MFGIHTTNRDRGRSPMGRLAVPLTLALMLMPTIVLTGCPIPKPPPPIDPGQPPVDGGTPPPPAEPMCDSTQCQEDNGFVRCEQVTPTECRLFAVVSWCADPENSPSCVVDSPEIFTRPGHCVETDDGLVTTGECRPLDDGGEDEGNEDDGGDDAGGEEPMCDNAGCQEEFGHVTCEQVTSTQCRLFAVVSYCADPENSAACVADTRDLSTRPGLCVRTEGDLYTTGECRPLDDDGGEDAGGEEAGGEEAGGEDGGDDGGGDPICIPDEWSSGHPNNDCINTGSCANPDPYSAENTTGWDYCECRLGLHAFLVRECN